ncbi:MAG: hypothetical protein ABEJ36_06450 [Candidatus Nanosalina sp.]
MFDSEAPLRAGLMGSGYIVAQGETYDMKNVDLYFPDSETFDQIKRFLGVTQANSSIHVLHVQPREAWGRDVSIEIFRSLSQPLGFPGLRP